MPRGGWDVAESASRRPDPRARSRTSVRRFSIYSTQERTMTMTDVAETSKPVPGAEKFRLLHTMIRVRDLDASLNFYTNLLGMKMRRKRDYPTGKFTLAFVGSGDETTKTRVCR